MSDNLVMPEISDRFDVDDIRKIRECDSLRYEEMTPKEIADEINGNAERVIEKYGLKKPVKIHRV